MKVGCAKAAAVAALALLAAPTAASDASEILKGINSTAAVEAVLSGVTLQPRQSCEDRPLSACANTIANAKQCVPSTDGTKCIGKNIIKAAQEESASLSSRKLLQEQEQNSTTTSGDSAVKIIRNLLSLASSKDEEFCLSPSGPAQILLGVIDKLIPGIGVDTSQAE